MTLTKPTPYSSRVSVPLPSDDEIREAMGPGYEPDKTGNFAKMFAGLGDLYPASIGMDKATFRVGALTQSAKAAFHKDKNR